MKKQLIFYVLLMHFSALALVDTKNGNYTKTYVDFMADGFTLERAYNSRSIYQGLFGYGWCSNLETRVEVLPDNSLRVIECGGGLEVSYGRPNRQKTIQQIMSQIRKKKGLTKKYISNLSKDLEKSPTLQSELIRAFNLRGKAKAGQRYRALGRPGESLLFTGNEFRRNHVDGKKQVFNKKGYLVMETNSKGEWMKIVRKGTKIQKILTNKGLSWQFRKNPKGTPGFYIAGQNEKVTYIIQKDNLAQVIRKRASKKKKKIEYEHNYDSYHNMIKTRYPDHTYEALTYNEDKDWVVSFKDRRGCREAYKYVTNKNNKDHYWTDVKKVCRSQVTNVSRYEFWNRNKQAGGKYLYRARQSVNGRVSDIIFDAKQVHRFLLLRIE